MARGPGLPAAGRGVAAHPHDVLLRRFRAEDRAGVDLLNWGLLGEPGEPFWLRHRGFVTRFIRPGGGLLRVAWGEAVVALEAGELAAPPVQRRVLRLAASVAAGVPVDLRDCFGPGDSGPASLLFAIREDLFEGDAP